ncbi:hypothetical protein [Streptomyces sp. enrichment culture]
MSYPPYQPSAPQRAAHGGTTSPLTFVLLITVPAVIAVAALRSR